MVLLPQVRRRDKILIIAFTQNDLKIRVVNMMHTSIYVFKFWTDNCTKWEKFWTIFEMLNSVKIWHTQLQSCSICNNNAKSTKKKSICFENQESIKMKLNRLSTTVSIYVLLNILFKTSKFLILIISLKLFNLRTKKPMNDHLSTTATIFGSKGWSLYTGLTSKLFGN